VGTRDTSQPVSVSVDPLRRAWQFGDAKVNHVRTPPAEQLCPERIVSLMVSDRGQRSGRPNEMSGSSGQTMCRLTLRHQFLLDVFVVLCSFLLAAGNAETRRGITSGSLFRGREACRNRLLRRGSRLLFMVLLTPRPPAEIFGAEPVIESVSCPSHERFLGLRRRLERESQAPLRDIHSGIFRPPQWGQANLTSLRSAYEIADPTDRQACGDRLPEEPNQSFGSQWQRKRQQEDAKCKEPS
jgi:hypothetical protein